MTKRTFELGPVQEVEGHAAHNAMRKMPSDAWFRWRCDDPKSLERLGLRLERLQTFADALFAVAATPLPYRVILATVPWLLRRQVDGCRVNRFQLIGGTR
jgi:hypothetical protein